MQNNNWVVGDHIEDELKNYLIDKTMDVLGGIVIIDADLNCIYMNDLYAKTMGLDKKSSLGKKIYEIVENTEMPNLVLTGKSDHCIMYNNNNTNFIVSRIPLMKDNKLLGLVGLSILNDYDNPDIYQSVLKRWIKYMNVQKSNLSNYDTSKYSIDNIFSVSDTMKTLKEKTSLIASKNSTVLITGESGTGKELFAHAIHSLSNRFNKPFTRINCSAIPENLLEAELFGYEKGSFTGALSKGKLGEFEVTDGGTMLLDEIDSLPLSLQPKLLRVLQEKEIRRIGGRKSIDIDVRMIFTTNKNLLSKVMQGEFREDLYYRINVVDLNIPPLRHRKEDLPILIDMFIKKFNKSMQMNITGVSKEAMELINNYSWPGNIRELENSIERAFNYSTGGFLDVGHFNLKETFKSITKENLPANTKKIKDVKNAFEKDMIIEALSTAKWNKKKAAENLGIDRSVLYYKIKKYNIECP